MIRKPSFFSILAKSPFKRVESHMVVVHNCVSLLPVFYEHAQLGEWEKAKKVGNQIRKLEADADILKRKLQRKLHGDLFLPVSRSDIQALLVVQDNMANLAEDLVGLMLGRKMVFPEPIRTEMEKLLLHAVAACHKAMEVSSELRDLFEAGFKGVVIHRLKETVSGLDALEDEADRIQSTVRDTIFLMEKEHAPVDVFFWYQFLHELSSLVDWAQSVGSQLLILSSR